MAKKISPWVYGDTPPKSWREASDLLKSKRPKSKPKSSFESKMDEIKKLVERAR